MSPRIPLAIMVLTTIVSCVLLRAYGCPASASHAPAQTAPAPLAAEPSGFTARVTDAWPIARQTGR